MTREPTMQFVILPAQNGRARRLKGRKGGELSRKERKARHMSREARLVRQRQLEQLRTQEELDD